MLETIEDKRSGLVDLCERHGLRRLVLFASALWDDFDSSENDLDFAVEFVTMSPSEHAGAYFGLLEALFGRRIDLVEIGAVRNPYFRGRSKSGRKFCWRAAISPSPKALRHEVRRAPGGEACGDSARRGRAWCA